MFRHFGKYSFVFVKKRTNSLICNVRKKNETLFNYNHTLLWYRFKVSVVDGGCFGAIKLMPVYSCYVFYPCICMGLLLQLFHNTEEGWKSSKNVADILVSVGKTIFKHTQAVLNEAQVQQGKVVSMPSKSICWNIKSSRFPVDLELTCKVRTQ